MRIERDEFCVLLEEVMELLKEDYYMRYCTDYASASYEAIETVYRFCYSDGVRKKVLEKYNCDKLITGRFTWNNLRSFLSILICNLPCSNKYKAIQDSVFRRILNIICNKNEWNTFKNDSSYLIR